MARKIVSTWRMTALNIGSVKERSSQTALLSFGKRLKKLQPNIAAAVPLEEPVIVGRLGGAFGIKGWVKLVSYTRPMDGIIDYPTLYVRVAGDQWSLCQIESIKMQGKGLVIKFDGAEDRDAAQQYRNCEVAVDRSSLPEPRTGEYYWAELVGLTVTTVTGVLLGKVSYLVETGANDVLVVEGDKERLIPYIPEQVIRNIDLDGQQMLVDWDPDF